MYKKYKVQINNSLIYTLSTIISKAIPFFLLPIFTSYLSKKDYGTLGLIASIYAIVNIYVGLRPSLFLIVKGPQLDKDEISKYIFNIFIVSIYTFLLVILILLMVGYYFFNNLELYIFVIIGFLALFSVFNEILETIFQIEKKAYYYGIYQLSKTLLGTGLALLFIISFNMDWKGKYLADIIVILSFSIFSILYLNNQNYITKQYDTIKQIELIKYLFPLSFHVLGLVMMSSIDRIFLSNMLGLESVGLYSVAYTIGALVGIIHDALLKVWSPEFYKRIKNANSEMKIKLLKFQYLYIIGSFLIFGIFVLVAPYIFDLMINSKFHEAYNIVPIIALGLTFESLRKLFISYHYNLGKNTRIAIMTLSAGMINAILNYYLIPIYGMYGAAYATLLAYIIIFILTIIDLNKIEQIHWRFRK